MRRDHSRRWVYLGHCVEYFQDLFLQKDTLLGLIARHQADHQLIDHWQQQIHCLRQWCSFVGFLIFVVLDQLVQTEERSRPSIVVAVLQEYADFVHNLRPSTGEVTFDDVQDARGQLRPNQIGRMDDRFDDAVTDQATVLFVDREFNVHRIAVGLLLQPTVCDDVFQVNGGRLSHRHLEIVLHDNLEHRRNEADDLVDLSEVGNCIPFISVRSQRSNRVARISIVPFVFQLFSEAFKVATNMYDRKARTLCRVATFFK